MNSVERIPFNCRECGELEQLRWMGDVSQRLMKLQLCHTCEFWHQKIGWALSGDPCAARIKGVHYYIGKEDRTPSRFRGCGGTLAVIRFDDGREVRTTNLWVQGSIPDRFRDRLPDNAVFVPQPPIRTTLATEERGGGR